MFPDDLIITNYKNGNTNVTIYGNGTKIREIPDNEIPNPKFPESIDFKITNYCDLGCPYCHENSNTKGKHASINNILNILNPLPSGIELALGGGNPLSHPDIFNLLYKLKEKGFITNMTINYKHIKPFWNIIKTIFDNNLIYGLGISISSNYDPDIITEINMLSPNIVYHIIIGVNDPKDIVILHSYDNNAKFLLLGYKQYGRGAMYYSNYTKKMINRWKLDVSDYLGNFNLSFDNLAIKQLNLKKYFTIEGWKQFYMGDDFTFTMYVDAVNKFYAPTSHHIATERVSIDAMDVIDYFQNFKKLGNIMN